MNQLTLDLDLRPVRSRDGHFWCCPHCVHLSQRKMSLIWKLPNHHAGVCVHCQRRFEFDSPYGREELTTKVDRVTTEEENDGTKDSPDN